MLGTVGVRGHQKCIGVHVSSKLIISFSSHVVREEHVDLLGRDHGILIWCLIAGEARLVRSSLVHKCHLLTGILLRVERILTSFEVLWWLIVKPTLCRLDLGCSESTGE